MCLFERLAQMFFVARKRRGPHAPTYQIRLRAWVPFRGTITAILRTGIVETALYVWRTRQEMIEIQIED